ncbi:hypothetical protein D3C72_2421140 [compost metagenome]
MVGRQHSYDSVRSDVGALDHGDPAADFRRDKGCGLLRRSRCRGIVDLGELGDDFRLLQDFLASLIQALHDVGRQARRAFQARP